MTKEHFIMAATTVFSLASMFYVPKDKYRLVVVSVVTFQALTWLGSLTLVQLGVICFPVREFPRATGAGFLQNFVFFPTIFVWFMLLFPADSSLLKKVLHHFAFLSIIAVYLYFASTYTDLQASPKKGAPLLGVLRTYANFLLYFIAVRAYVGWLSKRVNLCSGGQDHARS